MLPQLVAPIRPLEWPPIVHEIARRSLNPDRGFLVGGVVRDTLRRTFSNDLDLVTLDNGLSEARELANAFGGDYYPVDPQRGTGRAIIPSEAGVLCIDVATLRGETLLDDLQGRDFTINAICSPLNQLDRLIDPLRGQEDLFVNKYVRQCTNSSIEDDPIRALRAIRHALQFGLRLEARTKEAVRLAGPALLTDDRSLSQPERVRDELSKLLKKTPPASALRLLNALHLLQPVLFDDPHPIDIGPRLAMIERLHSLLTIIGPQRDDNTASDLTLGVAVMILDRYRNALQQYLTRSFPNTDLPGLLVLTTLTSGLISADALAQRLRLSNDERKTVHLLHQAIEYQPLKKEMRSRRDIYRYFRFGGEMGVAGILIALAHYLADWWPTVPAHAWGAILEGIASPVLDAYFNRNTEIIAPDPLVDGNDLMSELAIVPGPIVGSILDAIREEQAAGTILDRGQALALARLLRDHGQTSR